ncbi:MAG: hypothetical protein AABZ30_13040, partial [Myxococcota bacterium]
FDAATPAAILNRLCHQEPTPLDDLRKDAPPDLVAVVHRAIAKDRDARFESMAAMREALRAAFGRPERRATARRGSAGTWPIDAQITGAAAAPPTTFTRTAGERTIRGMAMPKRKMLALAGGATGALAAAAAIWMVVARPSATASRAPQPTRAAAVAPAMPAPREPAIVELRVASDPPGASLTLDGEPATSPLRAPRSPEPRVLRASAPGHRPAELSLRFDESREVRVTLERIAMRAAKAAQPERAAPLPPPPPRAKPRPAKAPTGPVMDDL